MIINGENFPLTFSIFFFIYIFTDKNERERASERLVKDLKWVEEFSETIVEILSEKFAS